MTLFTAGSCISRVVIFCVLDNQCNWVIVIPRRRYYFSLCNDIVHSGKLYFEGGGICSLYNYVLQCTCQAVILRWLSGADPGFQVRGGGGGGALKKITPSGGRRENFWGISCEKSRFYAKKSYFFSNFRGGARRVRPPLGSAPGYICSLYNGIISRYILLFKSSGIFTSFKWYCRRIAVIPIQRYFIFIHCKWLSVFLIRTSPSIYY